MLPKNRRFGIYKFLQLKNVNFLRGSGSSTRSQNWKGSRSLRRVSEVPVGPESYGGSREPWGHPGAGSHFSTMACTVMLVIQNYVNNNKSLKAFSFLAICFYRMCINISFLGNLELIFRIASFSWNHFHNLSQLMRHKANEHGSFNISERSKLHTLV